MRAIVDGDLISYRCSASASQSTVDIAIWRVDDLVQRILREVGASEYIIYLSGNDNFRKVLDPTYKANRVQERPQFLEDCREHLVKVWKAKVTDGYEADDAIGIEATACFTEGTPFVICSLDKDLRQLPGKHYSWEISGVTGGTAWTRKAEHVFVTPLDGLKNFYKQLLIGDPSDNIKGVTGIGKAKAAKIIDPLTFEEDMDSAVRAFYDTDERYQLNKQLLWILRNFPSTLLPEVETQQSFLDSSGQTQDLG
jgi:5'-3' exonuclease